MRFPAIFLDRDGTIIEDRGYLKDTSEVVFFNKSIFALQKLQEYYLLFIVSNQSGIGKGITSVKEVNTVNQYIIRFLQSKNVFIKDLYYCPHTTEDQCSCKKPNPFFLNKAADTYSLDLNNSFIIGDHPTDIQAGINAGVKPVYVLTGHGESHREEIGEGVIICHDILCAADYILSGYPKNKISALNLMTKPE